MWNAECGMKMRVRGSTRVCRFRTPHSALLLLNHRDLEPIRIGDRERAVAPRHVLRRVVQVPAACRDSRGQILDVLHRRKPDPHAVALLAIASLGEVVLVQHEITAPCLELHAAQLVAVLPALAHREPEHVAIPREAPGQLDRKSTRLNSSHSQISYAVLCLKKKTVELDTCTIA